MILTLLTNAEREVMDERRLTLPAPVPMVKWISFVVSAHAFWVRVLVGTQT